MVWNNEHKELAVRLKSERMDIEVRDPRGRSPLMLAITLGHTECVKVLLEYGASANIENKEGYTATHEAVANGDPELLSLILHARDLQKYHSSVAAIPDLLRQIRHTQDFYVEMKWEFTSWVPLLSRACPSDTYRIYKKGANVRIDTTLLGFEHSSWQRGKRSYIFCGEEKQATFFEVNHDLQQVSAEVMQVSSEADPTKVVMSLRPDPENIAARLSSPVVCTYVDTEKIHFERMRSGMLWKTDRTETVNGYTAKVYTASNVEFVTKNRVEHLSEADRKRHKNSQSPLQSLLGTLTEEKIVAKGKQEEDFVEWRTNPCHLKAEEYFDENVSLDDRDIGRPRESANRIQRFRATLWLCDDYPLSLAEQVMPIVDLMSLNSSHFAKLRSFITLQLPTGFPVKIEIPLFHVLNAQVTFGNLNGCDTPIPGVETRSIDDRLQCVIDPQVFEIPQGYRRSGEYGNRGFTIGGARGGRGSFYAEEDEDELLQYAIEQSLVDANPHEDKVTVWEALNSAEADFEAVEEANGGKVRCDASGNSANKLNAVSRMNPPVGRSSSFPHPNQPASALNGRHVGPGRLNGDAASVRSIGGGESGNSSGDDEELNLAIKLSRELCEEEKRKHQEDEEILARILQLSITDK
ncbi:ankyrin repeat domain-containing protein 13D [Galendromus occidentalis]|uniref:Ankyrin repeat domain-containing protein 13D n=1 Tax=Galendromus occidentalis TaxID=34638 RepID=A0AAJ7SI36_9ACAR|nr:ankyrin repeat domain-containing protein 13D [Galendromus occidentalis]